MITADNRKPPFIRVIAICLFRYKERILVFQGFDQSSGTYFYRPLGGGVDAGETSAQALVREIREEVGAEVTQLQLLAVLESIFTVNGRAGHEIVFVYDGCFVDKTLYNQPLIEAVEDNGEALQATWRALSFFNDHHRLVPEALVELLTAHQTNSG